MTNVTSPSSGSVTSPNYPESFAPSKIVSVNAEIDEHRWIVTVEEGMAIKATVAELEVFLYKTF